MQSCVIVTLLLLYINIVKGTSNVNILFILADDLGFNDVGYHNSKVFTPNINKLCKEGLQLENYYVQPICTPSRSQLMTGRYQIHTGLQHGVMWPTKPYSLPLDEVLLPQKLRKAGYKTHMIGKWHLGFYKQDCVPTRRGFDTFYGYYGGAEDYYTKLHKVPCHEENVYFTGYDFRDNEKVDFTASKNYSTYQYRDRAINLINNHDKEQPMFMYFAFQNVHDPLQAPKKYLEKYPNVKDVNRRHLLAMTTAMDDAIGDIVTSLENNKMMDNTIIVFSTDNGGQTLYGGNNSPLRGRKNTVWEGGIRGVGFVHGPGVHIGVSRELMHISDWFPTLCHLAGITYNDTKPLDGVNNWQIISDKTKKSNRVEILHSIDPMYVRYGGVTPAMKPYPNKYNVDTLKGQTALRRGRWKIITGDPGFDHWVTEPQYDLSNQSSITSNDKSASNLQPSVRLYDVIADPQERFDLSSFFPMMVETLLGRIASYNETSVPVLYPPCDVISNPQLRDGVWGPWVV